MSKFFNKELRSINRKIEKEKRLNKEVKVVMTTKSGKEEEFMIP